ncbi:MAG TPA: MarR family transcriptional regulator [Acidimicrobiia bacterium]|nr:MarR family transcriptional regulator [Acidimicrobiia bacterium]
MTSQDNDQLLRFVERFAMVMEEAGLPRMAARVFAYVLAEDSDHYTAAELAEGLRVSRAAISGAVRVLVQTGMLTRQRRPGSRVDEYRIDDDDVWAAINDQRVPYLYRWADAIAEGVDLVGRDTRGGRRLRQSQAYFLFMAEELPKLVERWHREKDRLTEDV